MNSKYLSKIIMLLITSIMILQFVSCRTLVPTETEIELRNRTGSLDNIIPKPVSITSSNSFFLLNDSCKIYVDSQTPENFFIAQNLFEDINLSSNNHSAIPESNTTPRNGNIYLTTAGSDPSLGDEGYELNITENIIKITAFKPEGLFRGVQTLKQIIPPLTKELISRSKTIRIPTGTIKDFPRFVWRGIMLDVVRHFFSVDDVKKLIDEIAFYKFNRFHIHLSDDQGWRIQIKSWPNLTEYGAVTQVGGGPGGYYTQSEYIDIIKYASERYITVIPEIDMPGHTNAALASYPELNCNGVAPDLYTGTKVGFSSFCIHKDLTYTFIDDVIREISQITPGPYMHIGGDEADATEPSDYKYFIEKVQDIVRTHGKQLIGWEEIAQAKLNQNSIVHYWRKASYLQNAINENLKIIFSPSTKAYLDMKYDSLTQIGQTWAAYIKVSDAYNWDPITEVNGIKENNILGVEAPLWTETITNLESIQYMYFPRLTGIAEIGWSAKDAKDWNDYSSRLVQHGIRWKEKGVNFYPSKQINWE